MTTLAQLIPIWLDQVDGADDHIDNLRSLTKHFAHLHHWEVVHVRAKQVEQAREMREEAGRDPLKVVQVLKRLIKFAAKEGVPNHWDEVQHVKLRSKRRRHEKAGEAVTREDIDRIIGCPEVTGQYCWAPVVAFASGQRKRAQQLSRWEHLIDWDAPRPMYLYANAKSGREDIRPASPLFVDSIHEYVCECFDGNRPTRGYIWANKQGEPWNRFYVWKWDRTKRLAGIPNADRKRWHDLRSGFVSHLIEQGLSLTDVAYLA